LKNILIFLALLVGLVPVRRRFLQMTIPGRHYQDALDDIYRVRFDNILNELKK